MRGGGSGRPGRPRGLGPSCIRFARIRLACVCLAGDAAALGQRLFGGGGEIGHVARRIGPGGGRGVAAILFFQQQ